MLNIENQILKSLEEFEEEFDHYNPKNDTGKGIPSWCGADYEAIKSHLLSSLLSLLSAVVERLRETEDERFICPNCGTNYIKETPCGNRECRNLEIVPKAKKWIPISALQEELQEIIKKVGIK